MCFLSINSRHFSSMLLSVWSNWDQVLVGINHLVFQKESESCSVTSNSLLPYGPYRPWNSPGQNTGVGSHSLLQRIFPTQGSNPGLLHCGQILYQLSHSEAFGFPEY